MMPTKLLRLHSDKVKEEATNTRENLNMQGVTVQFGSQFQLHHVASGRYLTSLSTRSTLNKASYSVSLTEGEEGSWFRVVPSFKAQAAGDSVGYGDLVAMFSIKREVLNVDPTHCKPHR